MFRWLRKLFNRPLILGKAPDQGITPDLVRAGRHYRSLITGRIYKVESITPQTFLFDCEYFNVHWTDLQTGNRGVMSVDHFARVVEPCSLLRETSCESSN